VQAAPKHRSWQVTTRPFKAAALALALGVALAGACEVAARSDAARRHLAPPSYGTRIRFFDLQMARLNALVRAQGPVDCMFLGSSGALQALDPQVFAQVYAEKTGRRTRCFNFGLPGASVNDARALAPILKRDYGIRLFVYAFTVRDVSSGARALRLEDVPWVERRTAAFNLDGFLTDASAAFRYFAAFRRWLDPNREEPFVTFPIREDGFYPSVRVLSTAVVMTGWEMQMASQSQGNYDPRAFSSLMALAQNGTQVVALEIPRSETIVTSQWVPEPARSYTAAYQEFRARLADKARRAHAEFIEAPPPDTVPMDGWADLVHMNARGAAAFSGWAAARVADAGRARSTDRAPGHATRHEDGRMTARSGAEAR
jgi:hypothetical protein